MNRDPTIGKFRHDQKLKPLTIVPIYPNGNRKALPHSTLVTLMTEFEPFRVMEQGQNVDRITTGITQGGRSRHDTKVRGGFPIMDACAQSAGSPIRVFGVTSVIRTKHKSPTCRLGSGKMTIVFPAVRAFHSSARLRLVPSIRTRTACPINA